MKHTHLLKHFHQKSKRTYNIIPSLHPSPSHIQHDVYIHLHTAKKTHTQHIRQKKYRINETGRKTTKKKYIIKHRWVLVDEERTFVRSFLSVPFLYHRSRIFRKHFMSSLCTSTQRKILHVFPITPLYYIILSSSKRYNKHIQNPAPCSILQHTNRDPVKWIRNIITPSSLKMNMLFHLSHLLYKYMGYVCWGINHHYRQRALCMLLAENEYIAKHKPFEQRNIRQRQKKNGYSAV